MNFREALSLLQTEAVVAGGHYQRRLSATSPLALFAGLLQPGLVPALFAEISQESLAKIERFPTCRGLAFEVKSLGGGQSQVLWYPRSKGDREVFLSLADDLHLATCDSSTEKLGLMGLVDRLSAWQVFLGREGRLLSRPEQEGLAGELTVINRLLDLEFPELFVLQHWVGPEAGDHDFRFPKVSLEVKAASARPNLSIQISNLRQLDELLVEQLYVALVLFEEAVEGLTLQQLVQSVRNRIGGAGLKLFENRLLKTGYHDEDGLHYAQPYLVRNFSWLRVEDDFPRLRRSDIDSNVVDAVYQIRVDGLMPFQTEEAAVTTKLRSELA